MKIDQLKSLWGHFRIVLRALGLGPEEKCHPEKHPNIPQSLKQ
jgi:hypothetical protein